MSRWKSPEAMLSASVVEPRMSAKRNVHSISAPPWLRAMKVKHEAHQFGFLSEGFLPKSRITGAPAPANGAAHSRQRGACGISFKIDRPIRSLECPPVRKSRQNSSLWQVGGSFELTAPT